MSEFWRDDPPQADVVRVSWELNSNALDMDVFGAEGA